MDSFQRELVELLPRLRRLSRALAGAGADADDLVQLCVERALRSRDSWTPGTRLDSWAFTIMRRIWIDETRARARRARFSEPAELGETRPDPTAPSLETRLAADEVERAMARLPEDQRLAVALVLVEGLSYREAAEVMDVPQGTLTSRLGRGRQALMDMLDGGAR